MSTLSNRNHNVAIISVMCKKNALLTKIILRLNTECQVLTTDINRQTINDNYSSLLKISNLTVFCQNS